MTKQQFLGGLIVLLLGVFIGMIVRDSAQRVHTAMPWNAMRGTMMDDDDMDTIMNEHNTQSDTFSVSTEGLPDVVPSEVVTLKDSDTYTMTAGLVKQEVGNRVIRRLAYNRMIPGPRIQVERGATITIVFKNDLELPTTLHSHGLRLDDDFDGLPTTMGGKQKEMQPGETFTYTLTFPDAGVYWYHPHVREDYTQEMGLYGNYHVTQEGYWAPVDREAFLIVDDFSENDPFYKDVTNKTMMGRFGNLFLINNDENFTMQALQGEDVRFFVTNVANTRTFDIAITRPDGRVQPLRLVGGDVGRIEKEKMVRDVVIAPAERWIIQTRFDEAGTYTITHREKVIGQIVVAPQANTNVSALAPLRINADDYALVRNQMDTLVAQKPDKKLRLTIGMKGMGGMMGDANGMRETDTGRGMMGRGMNGMRGVSMNDEHSGDGIEWEDDMEQMNAMSTNEMMEWMMIDEATGKVNTDMSKDWVFEQGTMAKIAIYNDPNSMHPMQHPIHFHGQRFVVLTRDGVVNDDLQWKDTVLVPTGQRITILVDMSNVGQWIAHCHIVEHMHAGMMFNFSVK